MTAKHRIDARVDDNQRAIVAALRRIPGVSVELGHDDILVGAGGATYWFEIKDPAKTLKKDGSWLSGAVKPDQVRLERDFRGHYQIVTTIDEILRVIL